MVYDWSTHGKLACQYCMKNNKAFTLTNDGKISFFYCHWQFLPINHKYRKNKNVFFFIRVKREVAPFLLSSEELYDVVSKYSDIVFGFQSNKQKFSGFGLTHNWVKRSIFYELSYWKINLFHHKLDVMHIENNMFENIFNMVMDIKGKIKDNIKARMDITLFGERMKLVYVGSRVAMHKTIFALDKNA